MKSLLVFRLGKPFLFQFFAQSFSVKQCIVGAFEKTLLSFYGENLRNVPILAAEDPEEAGELRRSYIFAEKKPKISEGRTTKNVVFVPAKKNLRRGKTEEVLLFFFQKFLCNSLR